MHAKPVARKPGAEERRLKLSTKLIARTEGL